MIELNNGDSEQIDYLHPRSTTNMRAGSKIARWDRWLVLLVVASFLLAIATLFVLFTPVINAVFGFMGLNYAIWNEWVAWATEMDRGLFLAVGLGFATLLAALLVRYRMLRDYSLYVEAGCPQCHERELIRVQRHGRDRLLGYFGIPVRRYSCRNCIWHGLRFAGYRYSSPGQEPEPPVTEPVEPFEGSTVDELPVEQAKLDLPEDHDWPAVTVADEQDVENLEPDVEVGENETVLAAKLDAVEEAQENLQSSEEVALGASDPAVIEGEEFERLCEEVALSKK